MNGNNLALDTNQAIALRNGTVNQERLIALDAQFWIPVPVAGELIYGALNSTRHADNLEKVLKLVSSCRILEITFQTVEIYADTRLKTAGTADSGE